MSVGTALGGLRFGPIGENAVHVAIDMQVVFAEHEDWGARSTTAIAPRVARIAANGPERTIFTRFLAPPSLQAASGQWQAFYRRWPRVLADSGKEGVFDLLPILRPYVPPARVIDKVVYSAFEAVTFRDCLCDLATDTLILTGVETDVCVLATALGAIDRGLRTILISDALASGSQEGHAAALAVIYPRFDQQVEVIDTETLLREWQNQ